MTKKKVGMGKIISGVRQSKFCGTSIDARAENIISLNGNPISWLNSGLFCHSRGAPAYDVTQRPEKKSSLWAQLLAIFLPAGYPNSVTDDYMWYDLFYELAFRP